jgi:hypothetical protein
MEPLSFPGKGYGKSASFPELAFDADLAAVTVHDAFD